MSEEHEFLQRKYARYPKLRAIDAALAAYFAGEPVTAHCIVCDQLLVVSHTEIEVTGTTSTWVLCDRGCTFYHAKGNKKGGTR